MYSLRASDSGTFPRTSPFGETWPRSVKLRHMFLVTQQADLADFLRGLNRVTSTSPRNNIHPRRVYARLYSINCRSVLRTHVVSGLVAGRRCYVECTKPRSGEDPRSSEDATIHRCEPCQWCFRTSSPSGTINHYRSPSDTRDYYGTQRLQVPAAGHVRVWASSRGRNYLEQKRATIWQGPTLLTIEAQDYDRDANPGTLPSVVASRSVIGGMEITAVPMLP